MALDNVKAKPIYESFKAKVLRCLYVFFCYGIPVSVLQFKDALRTDIAHGDLRATSEVEPKSPPEE